MLRELPGGAPDRPRIDAIMGVKALVLEANQHGEIAPIDLSGLERQAPAPIGGGIGAQQTPIAVEDGDGKVVRNLQRQGGHAEPPQHCGGKRCRQNDGGADSRGPAPLPRAGSCALRWTQPALAKKAESTTMPNCRQPGERIMPAKRTTHRSSKGTKLYAVRDKEGRFEDIQTYKRAHGQDVKRKSKAETKKVESKSKTK